MENWIKILFLFVFSKSAHVEKYSRAHYYKSYKGRYYFVRIIYTSTFTIHVLPHSSLIFRHFHEKFTREFRTQGLCTTIIMMHDYWIWRGFNVQVDFLPEKIHFLSSFFSNAIILYSSWCVLAKYTNCYYSVQ